MENQTIINKLVATILSYVQKLIDKAAFDRTFRARIISIISDGKYQIEWKGAKYTVKSSQTHVVGDWVWVCAPMNKWEELFILSA